jgi:D-alanyl-D-alanine-carboxypeptidase/D-alanyl-D-alanine-endopeptidase
MIRTPAFLIILILVSLEVGNAQTPPPDLQRADALGADLFVKSGSTGMVLVVVRDKEVFFRGYGETAPGSGKTPDEKSILRLCSLSKIFATDLLVKLAGDKLVRLDDPLQKFAPPHVVVPKKLAKPITLADLATHTSGLPREVGRAPHGTPHFTFPDFRYRWHWLPAQHLLTTPGTAALYSNVGFDLLGDALEKAAHEPYARLLAEHTTKPLGMTETGFTPNPGQCARLLLGAHDEGPCTDTQSSAGSSGVYSTATDMTVWLKYLLGTGTPAIPAQNPAAQAVYILPANLVSEKGLDHAGDPTGIGLGWLHLLAADDPSAITEKTGGGAGFLTYIALNQARHTGIFVAVTDGAIETHLNVFKEANNLLLAMAGLPPLPPAPPKPAVKQARKPVRKPAGKRIAPN